MNHLLLVEDDEAICEIIQFYLLEQPDYTLTVVHSAETAMQYIRMREFDLVILDIMLPGMDGLSFCENLRKQSYCPIIFISCMNDDETIIRALNMGGDDYLIKPFKAPVLLAMVEANIRRSKGMSHMAAELVCGELRLDTKVRQAWKGEQKIPLSPTEYEVLYYLMKNRDRFVAYDELYRAVWQRPSLGDLRSLFVHIRHLRLKVETNPSKPELIRTHMRGGYILGESTE